MTDPFANAVVVSSEPEEQTVDPFAGAVVVKEAPSVTVPDAYEEPKGDVASDVAQVLLRAGEGPTNVISDFVVNPFLKAFSGIDERAIDAISDEVLRSKRKSAFTALGSLMGVEQEEVLTPEGDYKDYATLAGTVGEIGTLLGGGIASFSAFKKAYPKLSNFKNSLASGAVADSFFFQEGQGNISRAIEDSFEIENHFFKDAVEYLSTDEADPVLTQRFKEGLETVIVFGGAEKLISGVFGITKKFIPSKDKSISEQAEELLTFIDENGNEIQIAKGNIHADVEFSPNPNSVAQIEQQASSRLRRFLQQMFTSRGYWTEEGDNLFRGKEYAHRQTVREAENIAGRLNQALDELPVDQLDEEKLTRALTEDLEFSPVASFEAKVEWVAADFNIPTNVAEDIVRAREMIDTLSARIFNSSVPSDEAREVIRQNIGEYMTRAYRVYEDSGYVPSENVVHNATKYIQRAMMLADETLEDGKAYEQAFIKVQEILDQGSLEEVFEFYSKNVQVNSSILRQRKDLPPEIRQLLGEIQNPTENIILTISKMSQLAENAEFGAKLLESGGGKYIFDEKRIFGSGNKQIIYNTKIEGTGTVLDGKYTTPEMATALAGRQSRFEGFESILPIRVFASAKASSQAMKTVASWTTHVRNAIGGLQFGLANGISPIGDAKAYSTLLNAALKRGDKGLDSLYEEYLGLGVINTSVRLNEFKTLFKDAAEIRAGTKSIVDLDPVYGGVGQAYKTADSAIKGATSKTYGALEAAYRATDDFFKIHAFEKELDFLKRANPDASIDDLKQEAARIVQDTFPNYDKVPNGIKALRFLPVGSFVSFPAEIVRTSVNIIQQGGREIASDNPVIKQRGMQRLAGYIATNSVWAGSATAGAMFAGIGEEENEAIQRMAHTPWSKSPKIPVRWGDEIITIDTQFIDSYSTVKEPFMVIADRVMNGQLKEEGILKALGFGVVEGIAKALAPYTDQAIVTEALTDIAYAVTAGNGRTPTGEQLFPKDDPKAWVQAIPYLFDAFKPGVVKSIENIGIAADGELRPVLRTPKKDLETELVRNLLGIPTRLQRPEEVIYFAGGQYKKQSSETTRPSIREDVEGEEYVEDMKTRYKNLYSYQQDLYMSLDATLNFLGPARAQELLGKQIGKKAAFTILNNRFYLPEVPELEEFLRLKDVTAEEAIQYHTELINARNQAMYTRLIPVEEETQREMNGRDRLARGGEVTNVPQVPVEPDERIDKMTGLPYNQQAGAAFMDIEDPERRQQLFIGGLIQAVQKKLKELPNPQQKAAEVLGISKEDLEWANSLGGKYGQREELDGRGDAARHLGLGWLAKQAKYPTAAKLAADAREILDVHGRKMDLANNQLGFDIAAKTRAEAEKKINEMIESKTASFMTPEESYTIRGYAKGGRVDKDKMACNKPRRTPNHPKKSHVVKACEDGKEKIIRFGEQGAKTAGKPKAGESARMKAKRKSFKARHRRNIKKGKMSAAYWADKTKW